MARSLLPGPDHCQAQCAQDHCAQPWGAIPWPWPQQKAPQQGPPPRGLGRRRDLPRAQAKGGKDQGRQSLQKASPLLPQNIPTDPSSPSQTRELGHTGFSARIPAASGSGMGKLHPNSTRSLVSSRTSLRASPGTPAFPRFVPKEGPLGGMERHPHYPRAAHSHASAQIASLNFITLSQFHEFNIVPGLLFA